MARPIPSLVKFLAIITLCKVCIAATANQDSLAPVQSYFHSAQRSFDVLVSTTANAELTLDRLLRSNHLMQIANDRLIDNPTDPLHHQ